MMMEDMKGVFSLNGRTQLQQKAYCSHQITT